MLLFDKIIAGVRCGVWHCTETIEQLAECMPNGDSLLKDAYDRFKSPSRQLEWIAVRTLLYFMLGETVRIGYNPNGAPVLEGMECHISISHTGKYVCIALSDKDSVGVDVERYANKVERVRARFLGDDEKADSLDQLLTLWSAKEAVFKLIQKEGVDFKRNLRSFPFNQDVKDCFRMAYEAEDECLDCFVAYEMHEEFVLTIAKFAC